MARVGLWTYELNIHNRPNTHGDYESLKNAQKQNQWYWRDEEHKS